MANRVFNEHQSYRGTWVMYLLLMTEIPLFILALTLIRYSDKEPNENFMALGILAIASIGVFLLLMNIRLSNRIDEKGVHFRYVPFINKWKTIPKGTIRSIKVITYSPISDFGGWGIKGNSTTKAYSIMGDEGLLIDAGESKKIMIGTRKAMELKAFLADWLED
ncbi:hypothetical protein [Algoriphagus sp. CAU 1675]|uniref:hypothetical protein n=1 Tax=Algoriphagus sp. CAU 1675 TaxID=3032597 RepID=UPI0023DA3C9C|nr:hypothetical protein [Algoriphagus sp. CAU 1675]MDF2157622.1 hypothetical protein [Algoriphagus sp. CAU 1675]